MISELIVNIDRTIAMKGYILIQIAQWVERLTPRQEVRRSILASSYGVTFVFDVLLI